MFRISIAFIAVCIIGTGCSTTNSRKLALLTSKNVVELKKNINKKIEGESASYNNIKSNIRDNLGLNVTLSEAGDVKFKKGTWIYNYIRINTAEKSRLIAGEILVKPDAKLLGILTTFIKDTAEENIRKINEVRAKQHELTVNFKNNIKPIKLEEKKINKILDNLIVLASRDSSNVTIGQIIEFGNVIRNSIEEFQTEIDGQ